MELTRKILRLTEIYGIDTVGKTEEELKREIQAQVLKLTPEPPKSSSSSESTLTGLARSFGKMMGEWERTKIEFQRSIEAGTQTVSAPINELKAPIDELKMNADNLLKVARGIGINTQGMTIDAIRNEVRKIIRI